MLPLLLAATLQTLTPGQAELRDALDNYFQCVSLQARYLGQKDGSPPAKAASAAQARCGGEWRRLRKTWLGDATESEADARRLAHWRKTAEELAAADLAKARRGGGT